MKTKNILLSLIAGLAAGTILGILLAPDKGSKTRAKILEAGEDLTGKIKQKFGDLSEAIADKYEQTLKETEALIEKGIDLLPTNGSHSTTLNRDMMKEIPKAD